MAHWKKLQNRPNEGKIAVDEISKTPTANVKRAVQAQINAYFIV